MLEIHELDLISLREENAILEKTFSNIPIAMAKFIFDKNFTVICANDAFYSLCGYTKKEYETQINYQAVKCIHPDDVLNLTSTIHEQMLAKKEINVTFRLTKPDSSFEWCNLKSIHVEDFNGFPIFHGAFDIITTAVNDAKSKAEYQMDTNALIQSIPGGVAKRSAEPYGDYYDYSDNYFDLIGYTKAEFVAMNATAKKNIIHPEDHGVYDEISNQVLKKIPVNVEYRIITKDGTIKKLSQVGVYIHKENGDTYYQCVFMSILDSRTAELLYKSEKDKLDGLLNSLPNGIVQYTSEGTIICYNKQYCFLLGYTAEGIEKGTFNNSFGPVYEDDQEKVNEEKKRLFETKEPGTIEYRIHSLGGNVNWIRVSSAIITNAQGKEFAQSVFTDCNSTKEYADTINMLKDEVSLIENSMNGSFITLSMEGASTFITKASDKLSDLLGFTDAPLSYPKEVNQLFIFSEDTKRNEFNTKIKNAFEDDNFFEFNTKLLTKDNNEIDIIIKGKQSIEENKPVVKCVLTDITKEITSDSLIQREEERVKILSDYTTNLITEYDATTEDLIVYGPCKEILGIEPLIPKYKSSALNLNLMKEEDKPAFIAMCERLRNSSNPCIQKLRLHHADDSYHWYEITSTPYYTDAGKLNKIFGKLDLIDDLVLTQEKTVKPEEIDELTGLYNQVGCRHVIRNILKEESNNRHILMLMNLNDFQGVNKKFGLESGDALLKDVANILSTTFKKDDVIGRIGGDEFIILLKNVSHEIKVSEKAEQLCRALSSLRAGENKDYAISGSVGASVYPTDGTDFDILFEKADFFLYRAKRQGKTRS